MDIIWSKSSRCANGACVEVRNDNGTVQIRDTKADGNGPTLGFTADEWTAFIAGVKDGEFDL